MLYLTFISVFFFLICIFFQYIFTMAGVNSAQQKNVCWIYDFISSSRLDPDASVKWKNTWHKNMNLAQIIVLHATLGSQKIQPKHLFV